MSKRVSPYGRFSEPVMSVEHNLIHGGELFKAGLSSASIAGSGTLLVEMIVPALYEIHLKNVAIYLAQTARFEFIEAPTITDGTTAIPIRNRKRSSVKSSILTLFSDPTGISAGTALDDFYFNNAPQTNIGVIVTDLEYILKSATKYLMRLTNTSGSAASGFLSFNWYDERVG